MLLSPEAARRKFRKNELLGISFPVPVYDTRLNDNELFEYKTLDGECFPSWAAYGEGLGREWTVPIHIDWYFDAREERNQHELRRILKELKFEVDRLVKEGYEVVAVEVGNFGASVVCKEIVHAQL